LEAWRLGCLDTRRLGGWLGLTGEWEVVVGMEFLGGGGWWMVVLMAVLSHA